MVVASHNQGMGIRLGFGLDHAWGAEFLRLIVKKRSGGGQDVDKMERDL